MNLVSHQRKDSCSCCLFDILYRRIQQNRIIMCCSDLYQWPNWSSGETYIQDTTNLLHVVAGGMDLACLKLIFIILNIQCTEKSSIFLLRKYAFGLESEVFYSDVKGLFTLNHLGNLFVLNRFGIYEHLCQCQFCLWSLSNNGCQDHWFRTPRKPYSLIRKVSCREKKAGWGKVPLHKPRSCSPCQFL